jgi:cyclic pyranopterin phosphate synthase
MPEEGLQWEPAENILTFNEIVRVVTVAQRLGVRTVRLTGGEPLMRHNMPELIGRLASLGLDDISMTTNGTTLAKHAEALRHAGLHRVNVSIDSLDKHRFTMMTRRDKLETVLAGIVAARIVGLSPIKVNCVIVKGVNDGEVVEFAALARDADVHVRFIEYMPLDADHTWSQASVVPSAEILDAINEVFPLVLESAAIDRPASVYRFVDGGSGSVGTIASISEPFCSTCDRLRLTADGQFRTCLFDASETDLRKLLRNGGDDEALALAMTAAVAGKQAGHGIGTPLFIQPKRSMSMIGG